MNQSMTVEFPASAVVSRVNESPACCALSDEVANAAKHRMQTYHYFEIRRLQCEFQDGILILRGQVSTYFLKQIAQEAVRSVSGVSRIINRLEVISASDAIGTLSRQSQRVNC